MRVLVTRPEPAAQATARRLDELGFEPAVLPLFETVFLPLPAELRGKRHGAVVFTSRNGVAGCPGDFPARDLSAYAVGPATAEAARAAGFSDVRQGMGNASGLAETIRRDLRSGRLSPDCPILYSAGRRRRSDLEAALGRCGITLHVWESYDVTEIDYSTDFLVSGGFLPLPPVVLLYSANAAARLSHLVGSGLLVAPEERTRFLCLSREVADALDYAGAKEVLVAPEPNEAAVLATIAAIR